jgi:AcrR family transcriptional regulator
MAEAELGPLPAGRHGLSLEQVAHSQRERLVAGLTEAVAERGYNAVTITHITKAAAVSRRAFYTHFESKEACLVATLDIVVAHIGELLAEAVEPFAEWPLETIAALRALLRFFAAEPDLARLCLVESLTAGPAAAERYRQTIHSCVPFLRSGRSERAATRALPDSTEDSLAGALASQAGRAVSAGRGERLEKLLPDFTEFVLTPYLGSEGAVALARDTS